MAKKFAKLNHHCFKSGCEGEPDQVIEVTDENLAYLLERGGAVECSAKGEPVPVAEEKADAKKAGA